MARQLQDGRCENLLFMAHCEQLCLMLYTSAGVSPAFHTADEGKVRAAALLTVCVSPPQPWRYRLLPHLEMVPGFVILKLYMKALLYAHLQ
jgi:hypothetical protein